MPRGSVFDHAGIGQDCLFDANMPAGITFGVELKLFCSDPFVTRQQMQIALNRALPGKGWIVGTDRSITPPHYYSVTAEIRSGILRGSEGCDQIFEALEAIKALSPEGVSVNMSCGLHVHVGCYGRAFKLEELKVLACNCVQAENAFDELVPPSRRNNRYCGGIRARLNGATAAIASINACTSRQQLLEIVSPTRYHKVNLHSLFGERTAPGTVEFRQPAGSQNAAEVVGFVVLFVKLVQYSCLRRRRLNVAFKDDEFAALVKFFNDVPALQHFLPHRRDQVASDEVWSLLRQQHSYN